MPQTFKHLYPQVVTTHEGNPCEGLGTDFKPEVSSPARNRSIDETIRNLRKARKGGKRKKESVAAFVAISIFCVQSPRR